MLKQYYFKRPQEEPRIILQERDLKILDLIDEFRFLDSMMLYKLIKLYYPGSYQDAIKRRLYKLWANGYLERPKEQVLLYLRDEQRHLVYTLAEEGTDILAAKLGKDREKLKWRLKQDELSYKFIEHALAISKFRTTLYLNQQEQGFKILFWKGDGELQKKITFRIETEKQAALFRVKQQGEKITLNVRPDSFFGLQKNNQIRFYEVELDRGSRTVKDMALKLLALYKLNQGIKERPLVLEGFPINKFKVLILSPSELRIKHLQESLRAIAERGEGLQRFLFTTIAKVDLNKPEALLEPIWQTGGEEKASLLN